MKAICIHNYGHSDVLKEEDVPMPTIKSDEILVKIHDAGINPVDWKIREGYMKGRASAFPLTMGQDFAGEVLKVGDRVTQFKKGDHVFGFASGSYAEFAAVPVNKVALIPERLNYETAAALPTAGLTAYQIVMNFVKPKAGQRILIHGAAGGVGSFIVQIVRHLGAKPIANAASEDRDYLLSIGAESVIDYKSQRFEESVQDVDAVIDLVGGETAKRSYPIVKKGGLLLSTVGAVDENEGKKFDIRTHAFLMKPDAEDLKKLADLVDQGVVKPRMDQVLPFEEFKEAQDLLQTGKAKGKVILEILH